MNRSNRHEVLLQESDLPHGMSKEPSDAVTTLPLNLKQRISVLIDPMTLFLKGRNVQPGLDRRCRQITHFHQPATVPVTGPDEGHLLQFSAY